MSKREAPRLAYFSEYSSEDSESNEAVYRARLLLLGELRKVLPIFFEKLARDVFPCYEDMAQAGYDFDGIVWTDSPLDLLPDDAAVKQALSDWASQFNANADWLVTGALRTLRAWHIKPERRQRLEWDSGHFVSGSGHWNAEGFQFQFEPWDGRLPWSDYSRSLRKEFGKTVAAYERKTRQAAKANNLIRTQVKYSPVNLEWFVLYQFAGMSSKEIADREISQGSGRAADESTILKGIKAAAKLIAWDRLRRPNVTRGRKIR